MKYKVNGNVNKFVEKWGGILLVGQRFLSNFVVRLDLSAVMPVAIVSGCRAV